MSLPGSGVLLVDKPPGPTSHDAVSAARRALRVRRIGHSGTLDPFASGLLLLCVGRATRLVEYLHDLPKSYEAAARLGQVTATLDPEGPVVEERAGWTALGREEVSAALAAMVGPQLQVPPLHSAKKVAGEPAHRRVRRGESVALEPAAVEIHELRLLELVPPLVRFAVTCSTGTYVRAIARDLGDSLGVGAHLVSLRRTAIGPFQVDRAVDLLALGRPGAVAAAWVPPLEALSHLARVELGPDEARRLTLGQSVPAPEPAPPIAGPLALASGGELVAIGELRAGMLRPRKVFARG